MNNVAGVESRVELVRAMPRQINVSNTVRSVVIIIGNSCVPTGRDTKSK